MFGNPNSEAQVQADGPGDLAFGLGLKFLAQPCQAVKNRAAVAFPMHPGAHAVADLQHNHRGAVASG